MTASARFLEEIRDAAGTVSGSLCRVCGARSPAPELWGDPGPRPIPHGPNCPVAIIIELEGRGEVVLPNAEDLVQIVRETCERLAPGLVTVPWSEVPEKNRALMVAVAAAVLEKIRGR